MAEPLDIKDWQLDEKTYHCRFHPFDWFHQVGCPHMKWTQEELDEAERVHQEGKKLAGQTLTPELYDQVFGGAG